MWTPPFPNPSPPLLLLFPLHLVLLGIASLPQGFLEQEEHSGEVGGASFQLGQSLLRHKLLRWGLHLTRHLPAQCRLWHHREPSLSEAAMPTAKSARGPQGAADLKLDLKPPPRSANKQQNKDSDFLDGSPSESPGSETTKGIT